MSIFTAEYKGTSTFISCPGLDVSLPLVLKGLRIDVPRASSSILARPTLAYLRAMSSYLYAAFAFVGFVLCAIPFYWHLHGSCHIFYV